LEGQPVIIKKVKKKGHGGGHGGAWKVAYADLVTAMMAFFSASVAACHGFPREAGWRFLLLQAF